MRAFSPIEVLRMAHFLRDLDDAEIEHLATALQRIDYDAGQEVFRQGDRPEALFFVGSGEVEVLRSEPGKPRRRWGFLVPADTLGEIEMVYRQPRQATIQTLRPTTLYRWNQEPLQTFMREHPAALAGLRFAATLQERLAKEEGEGQVPRIEIKDKAQEERLSTRIGLDRWTFQVRFEEKDVITYRKHWAILLGHIGGGLRL